jgi:hypothetical protein
VRNNPGEAPFRHVPPAADYQASDFEGYYDARGSRRWGIRVFFLTINIKIAAPGPGRVLRRAALKPTRDRKERGQKTAKPLSERERESERAYARVTSLTGFPKVGLFTRSIIRMLRL